MAGNNNIQDRFARFIEEAIATCRRLTFEEKGCGIWDDPAVVEYFARLAPDEPLRRTAACALQRLANRPTRRVPIVGGGSGRLGRHLVDDNTQLHVTEIDSSPAMSQQANASRASQDSMIAFAQ